MNLVCEFKMWAGAEGRAGFVAGISTCTDNSTLLRDHKGLKNKKFLIRCRPVLEM